MSFFICVSTHDRTIDFAEYFPAPLRTHGLTETPVGKLLLGGRREGRVVAVMHHGYSTDIMNIKGRTPNECRLFCAGLRELASAGLYVSVLVHWFRGDIHKEVFALREKVKTPAHAFLDKFPSGIIEDVKYILMPDETTTGVGTT